MLDDYLPNKVIAYIYHNKGRKLLTARDAVNFSKNQMHGLQMRSIHLALPETYSQTVLRVRA